MTTLDELKRAISLCKHRPSDSDDFLRWTTFNHQLAYAWRTAFERERYLLLAIVERVAEDKSLEIADLVAAELEGMRLIAEHLK